MQEHPFQPSIRSEQGLTEEAAQVRIVDFFTADPGSLGGRFDLIWDYTCYCAIDLSLRVEWAKKVQTLLAANGRLVMLIFPVNLLAPRDQGPPYPLDPEEITRALAGRFERLSLEPVKTSHPGREGKEWLAVLRARLTIFCTCSNVLYISPSAEVRDRFRRGCSPADFQAVSTRGLVSNRR